MSGVLSISVPSTNRGAANMFVCKLLIITTFFIFGLSHIAENDLDTITRHEFLRSDFTVKVNIIQQVCETQLAS